MGKEGEERDVGGEGYCEVMYSITSLVLASIIYI